MVKKGNKRCWNLFSCLFESPTAFYCMYFQFVTLKMLDSHQRHLKSMTFYCCAIEMVHFLDPEPHQQYLFLCLFVCVPFFL
jgi:hypothetical protein